MEHASGWGSSGYLDNMEHISEHVVWTNTILEQELLDFPKSTVLYGEMGLGKAEPQYALSVHMYSCVYSAVHLTGASLASV